MRTGTLTVSRWCRGKASELSGALASSIAEAQWQRLSGGRSLGRFLSTSRERLREVAQKLGVQHLANLAGCPCRVSVAILVSQMIARALRQHSCCAEQLLCMMDGRIAR